MAGKTNNLSESVEETAGAMPSVSAVRAKAISPNQKMGVVRYCQVRELSSGVTAVMKSRYKNEVHTLAEWDTLLEYVLNRKIG